MIVDAGGFPPHPITRGSKILAKRHDSENAMEFQWIVFIMMPPVTRG
jgi:hypothetical protein